MVYIVEDHVNLWRNLGMTIGFGSSSSINGSVEMLGSKSFLLSRVRSIKDGGLKFFHVARSHSFDSESMPKMLSHIH